MRKGSLIDRFIFRVLFVRHLSAVLLISLLALSGYNHTSDAQDPITTDTIPQTTKFRMKLGAYYFDGWAGKCKFDDGKPENAWAIGMPTNVTYKMVTEFTNREPIWGWRDDSKELMERQIDLAADNGLSYFAFDWYWSNNNGPINKTAIENNPLNLGLSLFKLAKNNNRMEFCLLVANHTGFEIIGEEAWKQAADYWITLFKHPRYLRVDGKPHIIIFKPATADAKGLAYLQVAARNAGFSGVSVAACFAGTVENGFTVKTHYNMVPGGEIVSEKHAYQELVDFGKRYWVGTPAQPYIPAMMMGWDKRPWEGVGGYGATGTKPTWYFEGNTPKAFGNFLESMAVWIEQHPEQVTKERLAIIYAWNEMGEGGWLVPTTGDPEGAYLKEIKRVNIVK